MTYKRATWFTRLYRRVCGNCQHSDEKRIKFF